MASRALRSVATQRLDARAIHRLATRLSGYNYVMESLWTLAALAVAAVATRLRSQRRVARSLLGRADLVNGGGCVSVHTEHVALDRSRGLALMAESSEHSTARRSGVVVRTEKRRARAHVARRLRTVTLVECVTHALWKIAIVLIFIDALLIWLLVALMH